MSSLAFVNETPTTCIVLKKDLKKFAEYVAKIQAENERLKHLYKRQREALQRVSNITAYRKAYEDVQSDVQALQNILKKSNYNHIAKVANKKKDKFKEKKSEFYEKKYARLKEHYQNELKRIKDADKQRYTRFRKRQEYILQRHNYQVKRMQKVISVLEDNDLKDKYFVDLTINFAFIRSRLYKARAEFGYQTIREKYGLSILWYMYTCRDDEKGVCRDDIRCITKYMPKQKLGRTLEYLEKKNYIYKHVVGQYGKSYYKLTRNCEILLRKVLSLIKEKNRFISKNVVKFSKDA